MAAAIGIKQANGDFHSILEEDAAVKKRIILTTAHDNQKSVQIDLYKSSSKTMADAMYIGSIVLDSITLKLKGEPSIEMILNSTGDGAIDVSVTDLGNPGNEQHLSVHLKSFEEDEHEYPGFDTGKESAETRGGAESKFPWAAVIVIGSVLILLCIGLWLLLFRSKNQEGPVQEASPPPVSVQYNSRQGHFGGIPSYFLVV
ncbi:MAG: Hsp70 family protein [Treponema sp.]|jgi:hypothetical protein|nr:Hsp70 family protein [Treponema sp.]